MLRRLTLHLVLLCTLALGACSSTVKVTDFRDEKPAFDLKGYFAGTVDGWGIVRNRDGTISQRFKVEMRCSWNGDVGTFDELFLYSDGTTQRRVWTFTKTADNRFTGKAADVVGDAPAEIAGNAFNMRYVLDFPRGDSTIHLDVDDWMYAMQDGVILNRSTISKFGFEVAQVFITFRRRGA